MPSAYAARSGIDVAAATHGPESMTNHRRHPAGPTRMTNHRSASATEEGPPSSAPPIRPRSVSQDSPLTPRQSNGAVAPGKQLRPVLTNKTVPGTFRLNKQWLSALPSPHAKTDLDVPVPADGRQSVQVHRARFGVRREPLAAAPYECLLSVAADARGSRMPLGRRGVAHSGIAGRMFNTCPKGSVP